MPVSVILGICTAIFLWASAFVGIRAGLHDYTPEGLAVLRYLIASFVMALIYFRLPNRKPMALKDGFMLMLTGVIGIGVYSLTLNYGELTLDSGSASFITSQSPLFTAAIAVMFLGERLNTMRVLGFLISFIGVFFIAHGAFGAFHWNSSMTYILLATISGSFYTILQKPYLKYYPAIQTTAYILWGGTLFLLLFSAGLVHQIQHAALSSTLVIVYMGIFPGALGYLAWSYSLAHIPASRAVSFLYFMPIIATLMGWLFLGEMMTAAAFFGGLLTILGVFIINRSYLDRLKAIKMPVPENALLAKQER